MKIAIPIASNEENPIMNSRFGRSTYYFLYDSEKETSIIIDNPAAQARGGAGIQASQLLVTEGVNAVIIPEIGPNADRVLRQSNVKIFRGEMIAVKELIVKWKNNQLNEL